MLNANEILARATMLYDQLGDAGLTRASLEELAKYRQAGVPFTRLSVDLKKSLMLIVRNYEEGVGEREVREAMQAGPPNETPETSPETPPPLLNETSETPPETPAEDTGAVPQEESRASWEETPATDSQESQRP